MKEQKLSVKIEKNLVIYSNDKFYSTFPWAVKANNGDIVLVFRQASGMSVKAAKNNQVTHHDQNSWVASISSSDNGQTWNEDRYSILYKSDFGVNDPALTLTNDGKFLMRVTELDVRSSSDRHLLKGKIVDHRVEHGLVSQVRSNILASYNYTNGKLLENEVLDMNIEELTQSCSREPVIELDDNSLLFSFYSGAPYKTDTAYLGRSFNQGRDWNDIVKMFKDENIEASEYQGINFNEASVVSLGNGEMLAVTRADISFHTEEEFMPVGGVGTLYSAKSFNWGLSWTRPKNTGIYGQPAHLLDLGDGKILCTYGHRKKPYGVKCVFSYDRGETWDYKNEISLRSDGHSWDLGYPMTLKLEDNKFLSVYYFNNENLNRFIAGTIWLI